MKHEYEDVMQKFQERQNKSEQEQKLYLQEHEKSDEL